MTLRRRFPRLALLLALLCLPPALRAQLHPLAVPGGVARLELGPDTAARPQLWLGDQPVTVLARQGRWQALVGIPLDTPAGTLILRQGPRPDQGSPLALRVEPRQYPVQNLRLKNKGQVELSPENEARVAREHEEIARLKRHWRDTPYVDTDFVRPAAGRLSGRFGVRRFFNGQPRAPHSGLDIAAARGTPVRTVSGGQVLAVADYFFNGHSVFIDHGQGLISLYCHLDGIDVHPGQWLEKGAPIGTVGSTGRSTGPHLHWTMVLNGTNVDPALFLHQSAGTSLDTRP
ncbi:MAG: peptidoglycan DD-metalloendopeptidase family protein [Azovibrio sp.]|uniref:peptidoglycan DD-metalloendopeptidase family protein n=1 Tax=Azovibrio sp. TaxID=1872673 RepID=UPI003C70B8B3